MTWRAIYARPYYTVDLLRNPPKGVVPDEFMWTRAMHALAHDPFHRQQEAAKVGRCRLNR